MGGKTYKKLFQRAKQGLPLFSDFKVHHSTACLIKEENDTITALSFMGSDTIADSLILHYDFTARTFYERIIIRTNPPMCK